MLTLWILKFITSLVLVLIKVTQMLLLKYLIFTMFS